MSAGKAALHYTMGRALGIDLGTTYTAVAVVDEHGKAVIVNNMEGQATTPSAVYIDHPHYIVGDVALQSTLTEPENVVQFIKRSMGLADYRVMVGDKAFSPEFISSVILRKIVQEAADALRDTIDGVVITVPAYFSETQRQATYEAGQLAGLNVLRIINEPTAAALSYGLAQAQAMPQSVAPQGREITYRGQKIAVPGMGAASGPREITYRGRRMVVGQPNIAKVETNAAPNEPRKILVYDLGGGTFDVTVLSISAESLDVVAVGGESHLGGKDWDDTIMNWLEAEFEAQNGVPLDPDASLEAELRLKAEGAKRQLTARPSVPINFKARVKLPNQERDSIVPVRIELTRQKFEELTAELLGRTQMCLEAVMERGELGWDDIAEILCVGGSSRMPMVRDMLTRMSGKTPLLHDPDECVAKGAALQAAILSGASEQAGTMQVNHVLPHTLGVATMRQDEAIIEAVVPALTPLPCSNAREEFTTTMDDQTSVSVQVYEGEAAEPKAYPTGPIGVFHLDTTPPRPRGVPRIRVEFRCDENGRIVAVARDQDTGKESRAFIHLGSSRTDEETRIEADWLSQAVVS